MHLGRSYSRSRSKSRSPAPPSPQPPSSPRFLPPSHYAAAAGIAYPPPSRGKDDDASYKARSGARQNTATPPSDVPSESSFEYKPRAESRFSLFARRLSTSSSPRPHEQGGSIADLPDLPSLEAQLLPTLRDTITRMTRPPTSHSEQPPSSPMLDPPRDRRRPLSPAFAPPSPRPQDNPPPQNETRDPPTANGIRKSSRRYTIVTGSAPPESPRPGDLYEPSLPADPPDRPPSRAPDSTPSRRRNHTASEAVPHSSRSANSRAPSTPLDTRDSASADTSERDRKQSKSALKSALRSPTPKSPRPTNVAWASASTSTTSRPSKASASRTPTLGSTATQTPSKSAVRTRSRTDPGTPLTAKPSAPSRSPGFQSNAFGDSSGLSQIPRPNRSRPSKFSDDSDVEYRWRAETSDRRKLIITNPSQSSESEHEPAFARRGQVLQKPNRPYDTLPARPSKLSDRTAQVLNRMSMAHPAKGRQVYMSDTDDESASEGSNGHGPSDSVTSTESVNPPPRVMSDDDRLRRRSALLDIVGAIHELEDTDKSDPQEQSESEFEGGQGVAYAGPLVNSAAQESEEESEYSEYEDDVQRTPVLSQNTPVVGQHRSINTVPTFVFSDDDSVQSDQHTSQPDHRHPTLQPQELRDLDAVALARQARDNAVRERMALGIPPSPSDGLPSRHTRSDSEASVASTVESTYWNDNASDLSSGAEAMLRKLSGNGKSRDGWRRGAQETRDEREGQEDGARTERPMPQFFGMQHSRESQPATVANGSSRPAVDSPAPACASANPAVESLVDMEKERVALIRDFIAAEEEFVARTRIFIEHFILPLRLQKSRRWVQGVPPRAARLLDWFEDIANLHALMLAALRNPPPSVSSQQQYQPSLVPLRSFLPRLELYQPYIVTFVAVAGEVRRDESDFGEFVGLQEGERECAGWDLERFLAEPVNRLAAYPGSFRRLLDLTPKTHLEYLETLALFRATDVLIKVMTEVKAREDEYDASKRLLARVRGLPAGSGLLCRERRLLHHGPLVRLPPPDTPMGDQDDGGPPGQRNSRLMEAINDWDRRKRAGSNATAGSYATTVGSYGGRSVTSAKSVTELQEGRVGSVRSAVYAFVFSDVILLAAPVAGERDVWILCEDVGVARVVGLDSRADGIMTLTVLPLDVFALDAPVELSQAPIEQLHLSAPDVGRAAAPAAGDEAWMAALVQCAHFSLLAISMPAPDTAGSMPGLDAGLRQRMRGYPSDVGSGGYTGTSGDAVSARVDEFPLPKSPSTQIDETQRGRREDLRRDEREERGWWHTRFQQVLWEVQQQQYVVR